jgi:hypothetical protein
MLKLLFTIAFVFALFSCHTNKKDKENILNSYANSLKPQEFAKELWAENDTWKGCFSADYSTFYFFRKESNEGEDYRIYMSELKDDQWEQPVKIGFSDSSSDLYPISSPSFTNGLVFISYRRIPGDSSKKPNANFWFSELKNKQWQTPEPIKAANMIHNYNSQPSVVLTGSIYFTSDLPDWSKTQTYSMEFKDGTYQPPKPFDFVNQLREQDTTKTYWEIAMAANEQYMIMTISEKEKEAKLYISYLEGAGWTNPKYLGDLLDCDMAGNFPYFTPDGEFLLFTKDFSGFYILPTSSFLDNREE